MGILNFMSHPVTPVESDGMQAFISARQSDILHRSIEVVRDCPDDQLGAELHRMAGSLGTFQLLDAYDLVRDLESVVASGDPSLVSAARADSLAKLQAMAITGALESGAGA